MLRYGSAEYWDKKYASEPDNDFDWYFDWEEYFEENIHKIGVSAPLLVIGCGNSQMSMKIEAAGITPVVSMDISRIVCKIMTERTGGCYIPMDVQDLQFRDESFDCVIDKGTLDAILCNTYYEVAVTKMMKEIARVLILDGLFFEISLGEPGERLRLLDCPSLLPWKLECVHKVEVETGTTYIYVLRKIDKFIPSNSNQLLSCYEEEETSE